LGTPVTAVCMTARKACFRAGRTVRERGELLVAWSYLNIKMVRTLAESYKATRHNSTGEQI
jgi:hypothetical protein